MSIASRLGKMFSKSEVKKMDEAAKKAAGSPGYDDDTMAAQKEFAKEKKVEKSKKLTKAEEKAADKEAYASAMGKDKPAAKKGKLTEKEKKELQESLEFKKGGMVKKMGYAKGGNVKNVNGVSPVVPGPDQFRAFRNNLEAEYKKTNAMSKATPTPRRGNVKNLKATTTPAFNKGGMVKANCGASMKPTQKAKK